MNKNDWKESQRIDKVNILCEDNDKIMEADVISLTDRQLVAAIAGVKITLVSRRQNGVYEGRMGGLSLVYKR
jgi:hypothetical protein